MTALELHSGQLWVPKSGVGARQIGSVWSAGVSSRFPMGTEVLTWFKVDNQNGHCTARAFHRWIKHTEGPSGDRVPGRGRLRVASMVPGHGIVPKDYV